MSSLTGKTPANTYKDLLQVSNTNSGIDGTLRPVEDGEGTTSPLLLSTDAVEIESQLVLSVAGGTAPLSVTSTDAVTNLNADMVDGSHAADFATSGHDHAGVYSEVGHDHSGVYSEVGHDHAGVYSEVGHDHAGVYSETGHDHVNENIQPDAVYTSLVTHDRTLPDGGPWLLTIKGANAEADSSGGPMPLWFYGGVGRRKIRVYDYTGLTGKTITVQYATSTGGHGPTTLTEGVHWTAATDNATTAESIRSAIDTAFSSDLIIQREGPSVYIGGVPTVTDIEFSTNADAAKMEVTVFADADVMFKKYLRATTGNETALTLEYEVDKAAGNDTGLLISQTDTSSPGTSDQIRTESDGNWHFKADNTGRIYVSGTNNAIWASIYGGEGGIYIGGSSGGNLRFDTQHLGPFYDTYRADSSGIDLGATYPICWASAAGLFSLDTLDTGLVRASAGVVKFTNGSTGYGSTSMSNLTLTALSTPDAPVITNGGTPGATAYSYKVVAKLADGSKTLASSAGSTATGNATLDADNYNIITWSAVTGAHTYDVYRSASAGNPASTGLLFTSVSSPQHDHGEAAAGAEPTANTTGVIDGPNFDVTNAGAATATKFTAGSSYIDGATNTAQYNFAYLKNYPGLTNQWQSALSVRGDVNSAGSAAVSDLFMGGYAAGSGAHNYHYGIDMTTWLANYAGGADPTTAAAINVTPESGWNGTIGTLYGIKLNKPLAIGSPATATFTNSYGLYMEDWGTAASGVTYTNPAWGLYILGTQNYIAGLKTDTITLDTNSSMVSDTVTLTDNSATDVLDIAVADTKMLGVTIHYTVKCVDATPNYQVEQGTVNVMAFNKSGTTTTSVTSSATQLLGSGTLTTAWTAVDGTNKVTIKLNANSSLTPTALTVVYQAFINHDGAVTKKT